MIAHSLAPGPVRIPSGWTPDPAPSTPAAELLERLNQLTDAGDEAAIVALLTNHPTAFAQDLSGWWCIRPSHGLDLQRLFSRLGPAVQLPPLRFEGFEWHHATVCTAALCHPGLKALNLHQCLLTSEAWDEAAQVARQTFASTPAGLKRLAITSNEPDLEDLLVPHKVSSEVMTPWFSQFRQLETLTLTGFMVGTHKHHMSYAHLLGAAQGLPLKRLELVGFMPGAFASPRICPALSRLITPDSPPLCLSLKGWRWLSGLDDFQQSSQVPVNALAEQTLGHLFRTGSAHLTIELIDMQCAQRISAMVIQALHDRTADVSLRLSCPEDPGLQHDMPPYTRGVGFHPLQNWRMGHHPALRGLHVQFDDASTFDIEVALALPLCSRLETMTVAIRAVPGGFGSCARRIDQRFSEALAQLPSLRSLELRSDHPLEHLPRLREQLLARDRVRV